MKVLYLQLPVLDFGYDYAGADHPLAGAYLASYSMARGIAHEPIFLDPGLSGFASTPALLREILAREPQVIVATLYLWNVQRTVNLALALRRERPTIRILAGGPETAGSFGRRFPRHPFHWVHRGEGEGALSQVLGEIQSRPGVKPEALRKAAKRATPIESLGGIPSPYLGGLLGPAPDGSIWVETMRGCPFSCAFCYYGKSMDGVRWFPKHWLKHHILWAGKMGVKEIYLLDPSFQVTPGLRDRLREIALWNQAQIPLHTEARVEGVDRELARAFYRAGFRSLETGLQSLHDPVLKKLGRKGNARQLVEGARILLEEGIKLEVDLILGLPGDTPEGFLETVDFLVREGLGSSVTVFPLLVLPGTKLRQRARSWKVRYRPSPPYQVEAVGDTGIQDFQKAMEEAERRLGVGLYPQHLPDLTPGEGPYDLIGLVEIRQGSGVGLPPSLLGRLAQCPVFLFCFGQKEPDWPRVLAWAQWQRKVVPDLLPFWGFEVDAEFSISGLESILRHLHDQGSYQAGLWSFCPDPYLRLSCRPFVLSPCRGEPGFWLELDRLVPVIRVTEGLPVFPEEDPLKKLPVFWRTSQLLDPKLLRIALGGFLGREEELLFSRWENAVSWARVTGLPLPPGRPRMGRTRLP